MRKPLLSTVVVAIWAFPVLTATAGLGAETRARPPPVTNGTEPLVVDEPVFPGIMFRDRLRIWTGSSFAPNADFGDAQVSVARPALRLRATAPVNEGLSLQLTADFSPSLYETAGDGAVFEDCSACRLPEDLYSLSLGVQGGLWLNRNFYFLRDDERWALLSAVFARARWEPDAFDDAVTGGLSLGIGYQIPDRLRLALGARLESSLGGKSVSIGPIGYLRWDVTKKVQLLNRGVGLQLEYRPSNRFDIFVTGFRSSERFLLDRREDLPSGTTLSDRQVMAGGGVGWKIANRVRLATEVGAIVWRRLSLNSDDEGTLASADGDVSPYFGLRLELRP